MDADVSSALLGGSSGGVQCEKRKGVIRRLLEWIQRQWGRVRNFFRRRKKQPVVTKTVVEEEDDIETVALSVYEAPTKVSLVAPETTPEPKVEEYVLEPVPNLAAIQKEREEAEAKKRAAEEEESRRTKAEEERKKEEEERAAARKRAEEQKKAQEEAKARKLAEEQVQAKKIASLNMAMDESARSESSRSVSDPVPDLEPIVKKDQKGIPVTMEDAMELTTNARRASLPVAAVASTTATKKTKASKKKETRRASYAIGAKPPVAPKQQQARRSSSIEWVESAPAQLKKTAELQPQQATKGSATTAAPRRTSTSSIEWVESAPAQLRKTQAGQKAMVDGSLERSITRINEEQDPNLAWEKPDWAKQGGRKSLRKSFQHNLW